MIWETVVSGRDSFDTPPPHFTFVEAESHVAQGGLNLIYNEAKLELLVWLLYPEFLDYSCVLPQQVLCGACGQTKASCMIDTVLTKPPPQLLSIHHVESQLEQTKNYKLICLGNEGVIFVLIPQVHIFSLHSLLQALWRCHGTRMNSCILISCPVYHLDHTIWKAACKLRIQSLSFSNY